MLNRHKSDSGKYVRPSTTMHRNGFTIAPNSPFTPTHAIVEMLGGYKILYARCRSWLSSNLYGQTKPAEERIPPNFGNIQVKGYAFWG